MQYRDYYQIMGLKKDASAAEIKKIYRKLARKYHPDVNPGNKAAEDKFKEINEAYEVLSDPEKRKKYDQFGSQWQQYERSGGRPEDFDWSAWTSGPGSGRTQTRTVTPEEFEQMFGGGMGGFSDFFETLFGGMGQRAGGFQSREYPARASRGSDSETTVQITLDEAFHGTTRSLQYEGGRRIEAKIPAGVHNSSRVRLSGQGAAGPRGGKAGDLYLNIEVLPHTRFEREGDDLKTTVPVDLYMALLGGKLNVPGIDKAVELTIPAETNNGKVFRLRGLGMPNIKNPAQRGNLYVTVEVSLPKNLNAEEKRLYQQLKEMRNQ